MPNKKGVRSGTQLAPLQDAALDISYLTVLTRSALDEHLCKPHYCEADLADLANILATRADSRDHNLVEDLAKFGVERLADNSVISPTSAISLLFNCTTFYERTGKVIDGFELSKMIRSYSADTENIDMQRRSHSIMGNFYARLGDFTNSCLHYEAAYNLASEMRSSFLAFSALSNTVASLEDMGLLSEAKELALRIAQRFEDNRELDLVHISNASNGVIISHLTGDLESAAKFYEICKKAAATSLSAIDETTRAYFEAARATHLTAIGEATLALHHIDEALVRGAAQNNIRINAILCGAQAEVRLAIGTQSDIDDSRSKIKILLKDTVSLRWHHEDLLRTLYKLYSGGPKHRSPSDRAEALRTLKLLREHMISVKHGQFYSRRGLRTSKQLVNPSYTLPNWMRLAGNEDDRLTSRPTPASVQIAPLQAEDNQLTNVSDDIVRLTSSKAAIRIQTAQYRTAENWAVAADFASGGDGRDCLRVGKLAAMVALEVGFSRESSMSFELACRLRNVGEIFTGGYGEDKLRSFGKFSPFCEHTILGESILAASSDSTLQLAAKIAKTHHEWWNGCGYPLGLAGLAIPLEGRICMLADTFISCVTPFQKNKPLSFDQAFNQIGCMAGVQIDPNLVAPLRCVLDGKSGRWIGMRSHVGDRNRGGRIGSQSPNLLETLELAVVSD